MKALTINGLTKTYADGFEALKGINLEVAQGDFYALLGPNGAGKSTTIGIISSLVNKTSGHVEVFGYDIDKNLTLAKQHIGLVPQEFNFNQFETVLQVVMNQAGYYGVAKAEALLRAEKYLTQLELWGKKDVKSRELSGGMKRRLMIARALMHQPQLLILDEPTAGVDIELRRSMWEFLQQLNESEGVTIILTTHYLEEAEMLCRNIGIIDHGVIVQDTTMKALLSQLNVETFILDVTGDLQSLTLDEVEYRVIDDHTLEVDVERDNALNTLFSQLTSQQVQVMSMRNKANRLEELFINLVNQSR
ncbi:ABC transporter ATP-binding protein [Psychrobium sp. 1_MG-2023]|uniref:ABC transporter ATP-binding protein n=1 Tax=Psychrobium sp. 1_MG-2023 TaxID=3062624 RepID=UPI000C3482CC|nr:ABC transporter ATP-binding protein [Psychrobium sp. 1_MG-2023]MDP2561479.1 ABC transporter ATP-binding protein [Psychrobium sp. 1_MG-2023]PKF57745.1 ABC transporter [Alteromonadales bacterium alter-6D02]